MARINKLVRIYEPIKVGKDEKEAVFKVGFWPWLMEKIDERTTPEARMIRYGATNYLGATQTIRVSPQRHVVVGRVRPRSDWPSTTNVANGEFVPLRLRGMLVERAFLVPFGNGNKVGFMSPVGGRIGITAVERWLSAMAGYDTTPLRIELRPEVDSTIKHRLKSAAGVSRLSVKVPNDVEIDPDEATDSAGDVGKAIASATMATTDEMTAELTWSLGHQKKEKVGREALLRAARWLYKRGDMQRIDVNIVSDDGESIYVYHANLMKEFAAVKATFEVEEDSRVDDSSTLQGIREALFRYQKSSASLG